MTVLCASICVTIFYTIIPKLGAVFAAVFRKMTIYFLPFLSMNFDGKKSTQLHMFICEFVWDQQNRLHVTTRVSNFEKSNSYTVYKIKLNGSSHLEHAMTSTIIADLQQ